MPETINLSDKIEKQLPAELITFMRKAGEIAASRGQSLYLVGGVVRDLLLRRTNFDLDLVVEGDAIELAQELVHIYQAKITTHPRFNTAKLQRDEWSVDLTTARSETYARPGALPSVTPGSLSQDLFRRDFTINAMAVRLDPVHYSELIDPYGGRGDLEHKVIRILHDKSFTDDATRIWRALRYEQRLDFHLEPGTLQLLRQDMPMLNTISGDRIRYELECTLREERPEKVLRRTGELKVLQKLYPALRGNGWLSEKFEQARQLSSPDSPTIGLYLALMVYHLTNEEIEDFVSRIRLRKSLAKTLRDTISIKGKLQSLANPELTPSVIYHTIYGYSSTAITASLLASDSPVARQHIQLFLSKFRYIRPKLTGNDLKRMGIPPGPHIKEMLRLLHEARLDEKATTRRDEENLVNSWLAQSITED